jgi:hypothetical protein
MPWPRRAPRRSSRCACHKNGRSRNVDRGRSGGRSGTATGLLSFCRRFPTPEFGPPTGVAAHILPVLSWTRPEGFGRRPPRRRSITANVPTELFELAFQPHARCNSRRAIKPASTFWTHRVRLWTCCVARQFLFGNSGPVQILHSVTGAGRPLRTLMPAHCIQPCNATRRN